MALMPLSIRVISICYHFQYLCKDREKMCGGDELPSLRICYLSHCNTKKFFTNPKLTKPGIKEIQTPYSERI
jgi:hypothetical protein